MTSGRSSSSALLASRIVLFGLGIVSALTGILLFVRAWWLFDSSDGSDLLTKPTLTMSMFAGVALACTGLLILAAAAIAELVRSKSVDSSI